MRGIKTNLFLTGLMSFFVFINSGTAQQWTSLEGVPESEGLRQIIPDKAQFGQLDITGFQAIMQAIPHENNRRGGNGKTVQLLSPDGKVVDFQLWSYDMYEPELAAQFPTFKTFYGISVKDPTTRVQLDWTDRGLRAFVMDSENGAWFVDPLFVGDIKNYQSYFKKDYRGIQGNRFECSVTGDRIAYENLSENSLPGDCNFRTYRLAMATTAEYSNYHGGDTATVLSEVTTAMNRVNGVYEKEVGVRMILINNTTSLFYFNASSDPYTNTSGSTMLGQNQTNIDNVIGSANYDLGHVFSTGGGGIARLRSPCSSANKAQGVTGLNNPVNDPFYIDYVAHEIGHQFGGNHTFNSTAGSCGNNIGPTSMEPGSGTTIQAYAGICAPDNVQNNSDAYFHGVSLQEIGNFVTGGGNCATIVADANSAPTVVSLADRTIPRNTPFVLEASATDLNSSDVLTYCWEQWDTESATMPPQSSSSLGPLFRTFFPTTDSKRYFPKLSTLPNGSTWEVLPNVGRTMEFRVSVRDNAVPKGCTVSENVVLTVSGSSGPFVVNTPLNGAVLGSGSTETVTWNVANTNQSPVNCALVDIYLSTDGGMSYPTLIANDVPNTGTAGVTMPAITTTTARLMIKGNDNYFFNVNPGNFAISNLSSYSLEPVSNTQLACLPNAATFIINTSSSGGFTTPILLTISNLPSGVSASFSTNPVVPGQSTTLTVNNVPIGSNTLTVNGNAGGVQKSVNLQVTGQLAPTAPNLVEPANNASATATVMTFDWSDISNAVDYDLQIATNASFTNSLTNVTDLTTSQSTQTLTGNTTYYWRVRSVNECGSSTWTPTRQFTTESCYTYSATGLPQNIPDRGLGVLTSSITVPDMGTINDLRIVNLVGTHTYIRDLEFTLTSPTNASAKIIDNECDSEDDFNLSLSDGAPSTIGDVCPFINGNTYQPSNPLTQFDGLEMNGTWQLTIADLAPNDVGTLQSWDIQFCVNNFQLLPVELTSFTAKTLARSVQLDWTTATEENNSGFRLLRSTDGRSFEQIAFLKGAGTTTDPQNYRYTDQDVAFNTTYYYQLEQVDLDGSTERSDIVNARIIDLKAAAIQVVPNPFTHQFTITGLDINSPKTMVSLVDTHGKLVYQEVISLGNSSDWNIDVAYLPTGVYFLNVTSQAQSNTLKIVKQ